MELWNYYAVVITCFRGAQTPVINGHNYVWPYFIKASPQLFRNLSLAVGTPPVLQGFITWLVYKEERTLFLTHPIVAAPKAV